jgi:hypothetical protein
MAGKDTGKDTDPVQELEAPAPEGMFPKSVEDTVQMVKDRRNALADAQGRYDQAVVDMNRLRGELDTLNSMRSAHGEPPL